MKQPDILIFMSDQHGADYGSWGPVSVDTPVLAQLRREGISFEAAYTSCPLCVPARMSMMSSLLPSRTGIYGNSAVLADTTPCFTHALVAAGYETVLIGRMHFVGRDQRHGFTKRLAPDMTPVTWNMPFDKLKEERGDLNACTAEPFCTNYVGAGESPVMHYDRMVVDAALEYLSQEHEKPQFILVGTYGPHFPYITSRKMYEKYYDRVSKPRFFDREEIPAYLDGLDVLNRRVKPDEVTWEIARGALAAYCGLIEIMDGQIGEIYQAFEAFTGKRGTEGIFGYLSDHGDTAGERRMFGKQTYFDKSAKIPLIFAGGDIPKNRICREPVSIMDLGSTVCELAGTRFEGVDGISLTGYMRGQGLKDRMVTSQFVECWNDTLYASTMLRYGQYKYISYHGYESLALLFDMEKDPEETKNIAAEEPDLASWFAKKAAEFSDFERMEQQRIISDRNAEWFQAYEQATGGDDTERWKDNPPTARGQLEIAASRIPVVMKKKFVI